MKNNNPSTIVSSYFFYMWNTWDENECKKAFPDNYKHFWNKWCSLDDCTFGKAEKFYAELSDNYRRQLVDRATFLYDGKHQKSPEEIKQERLVKPFNIINLTREDLETEGYDIENITDQQIKKLCMEMCNSYCELMFWDNLRFQANKMGLPKKEPIKNRLKTINQVVSGHLLDIYQCIIEYLQKNGNIYISEKDEYLFSIEYKSFSDTEIIERQVKAIRLNNGDIEIFSTDLDDDRKLSPEQLTAKENKDNWKNIKNSCLVIFIQTLYNISEYVERYG